MSKRRPTIKYTSRDFTTIKRDLVDYAKRYYPDTFQDFSEASFGSLMLDSVSYIGDILSFYLDYQTNESFLDTAVEFDNILRLGREQGYKFRRSNSSFGEIEVFVVVPAVTEGLGPDTTYMPTLKRGSKFSTTRGSIFTLINDVDFSLSTNEIVVAAVNSTTGIPESYAVRAKGRVTSGEIKRAQVAVGAYEKFRRVKISDSRLTEIVSVFDSQGREYYEVDYLSQNVVYRSVINTNSDSSTVPNIMKPVTVPRRFTVVNERNQTFLQFGFGSEETIDDNVVLDPSKVVFDRHGRDHTTDFSFDPSKLTETEKLGVVPSNTTLTITYRKNTDSNANSAARTINVVSEPIMRFANKSGLSSNKRQDVVKSLEVDNEFPITGDVKLPSADELKIKIGNNHAMQNRAVTREDYKTMAYSMPANFGAIKRCNIVQDRNSFKRNMNMYVISNLPNGKLSTASNTLKQNLKLWINKNKMINDTIDILDAKIINLGIDFDVVANIDYDPERVLVNCVRALRKMFFTHMDIGENLVISDISNELSKVEGVSSVEDVSIRNILGGRYSPVKYNINRYTTSDGKMLFCPENAIFEVKRPGRDIRGVVR